MGIATGISGIAHIASDVSFNTDPEKVVTPMVKKIEAVLSIAASIPTVKRVVITSSSSAATFPAPGVKRHISTSSWNDESLERAWAPAPEGESKSFDDGRGFEVYAASKTAGERAAWKYVKENQPGYVLNTILPNMAWGPMLHKEQGKSTNSGLQELWESGKRGQWGSFPPQWMNNVVDIAKLHVAALIDSSIHDERIIAFAEPFNWTKTLKTLRELCPDKEFEAEPENESEDIMDVDNQRAAEILTNFGQPGWVSFKDTLQQFIDTAA